MEKTMNRKMRTRFVLRYSDVACAGISMILGGIISPLGYTLALLYVSYSFLRCSKEAFIAIFFILMSTLIRGIVPAYFYALGFAIYFTIIYILKLRNRNLYQWLPYISFLVVLAYSYQAYQLNTKVVILPIMTFILMKELFQDYTWITKKYALPDIMKALLVLTISVIASQMFPIYNEIIYMCALFSIVYISNTKILFIMVFVGYLLLEIQRIDLLIIAGMLSVFKDDKKASTLLIIGAACFVKPTFDSFAYLLIAFIGVFAFPHKVETTSLPPRASMSKNNVIKRQMNNYAGIFQLLSDYYARHNDVQSEILSNMASALQYNADIIRKSETEMKDSAYIQKALEGYQYDVKDIQMEEPTEGNLQIQLEIGNMKRGEIRTTLLPLLEVLLHRKFELQELQTHRFINTTHSIIISEQIPFNIHAYADSVKNSYTSNGDTFSIFRFRQSVVCMISDGMGNGEHALESSRLITNIFQRMMISGIPQDHAIRCINKLVQSDTFATLDVLCFNKAQGVVYISKSAACPTFLLRDHEIYEISGNALPVGIVSQIQPDCFQIECQCHDEYLMVSDGVSLSEIQEWLRVRKGNNVKEDVEAFRTILGSKRRMDDSTLILASVDNF